MHGNATGLVQAVEVDDRTLGERMAALEERFKASNERDHDLRKRSEALSSKMTEIENEQASLSDSFRALDGAIEQLRVFQQSAAKPGRNPY